MPTRGHGAVAGAAAVRPARRHAGRRDGVCANVELPVAAPARRRRGGGRVGHRPRRGPVAAGAAGLAAAGGRRRAPRRAVAAALAAHLGATRRRPRARAASPPCATSPSCSTATRCTGRRWSARGRGRRRRRAGRRRWQAELWRRLRARIGVPEPGRAARAARARGCATSRSSSTCPPRLSLFGLTRLPAGAPRRSSARWPRTATSTCSSCTRRRRCGSAIARRRAGAVVAPRATTRPRRCPRNRLLASWGQDARELQLVLGAGASTSTTTTRSRTAADTLLARLQADVARRDRRPPRSPTTAPPLDPTTAASQVHACHGRARQVEVLRDAILHLLADDPTLEPRDVIVMCPDIETFAPLIQATFGAGEVADEDEDDALPADVRPPDLRVRLADRSLRQTNPVLGVVARLLELADAARDRLAGARPGRPRAGPPALPPRRRRPRPRSRSGSPTSGIRWGLDAAHRAPFKLDALRRRHLAGRARPRAGRRDDDRGRAAARSAACCRSTTSTAATSTSPAASPSSSTGCGAALDALARPQTDRRRGPTRSPTPPTR